MGIPDTYTMPINEHDFQIFIARATAEQTTTSDSSTQEHLPPCTHIFRTALFYYKQHQEQPDPPIPLNQDSSPQNFTFEDIKKATHIKKFTPAEIKKATRNYREQNIIGEGGQGIVYKGILPNNQLIAVKRPWHGGNAAHLELQFLNEINILSQINHTNVVKFLGCCFETNKPSIIFEYISNGSLYDHLFDKQKQSVLTWNHRLRIAVQVAEVLEYMHTTIRVPIIHKDIKSRNILLDDNFMVKVSDFGGSKILGYQNEFNTFDEDTFDLDCLKTGIWGTAGYMDPDYLQDGLFGKKSDVYGFGVVLAELLTSQEAFIHYSKAEDRYLAPIFLGKLLDFRLEDILDRQLVNEESMEQIAKVANLAGRCLGLKRNDRPTMRQVLRELQDISAITGQPLLMRAQQLWKNRNKGYLSC